MGEDVGVEEIDGILREPICVFDDLLYSVFGMLEGGLGDGTIRGTGIMSPSLGVAANDGLPWREIADNEISIGES